VRPGRRRDHLGGGEEHQRLHGSHLIALLALGPLTRAREEGPVVLVPPREAVREIRDRAHHRACRKPQPHQVVDAHRFSGGMAESRNRKTNEFTLLAT
jgi:hypothetical protein